MNAYPTPMLECLEELKRLPGIGPKSAQRILFYLLDRGADEVSGLSGSLERLAASVETCPTCRVYKQREEPCVLCSDPRREGAALCVVESAADVYLIESSGVFRGRYHVLHGLLSPMKGVDPRKLGLDALGERLESGGFEEVILATPPTAEGEVTASYLASFLAGKVSRLSRLAYGLPVGADFQYVDRETLGRALSGRRDFS